MRRNDREITDNDVIDEIIGECKMCRVALSDDKAPYIVPMNFGFAYENGKRVLYFHGAKEGRKASLIKKNGYAAFEMDTRHALREAEGEACGCTYYYACVMGEGRIEYLEGRDEKIKGLDTLMRAYSGKETFVYNEALLERVGVMRLEISEISCKSHEKI